MKKYRITFVALTIAALILEALPYGAVCNFATPEKTITETFSYFSLTPLGYANSGPFLTAIMTCLLCIISIILLIKTGKKLLKAAQVISVISLVFSLFPLLFGLSYYNAVSFSVSLLMIVIIIVIIKIKKGVSHDETQ